MKLIETKEQLTLNELMRIAYEYGNDNAILPENNIDEKFNEWIKDAEHLFKKLTIPVVVQQSELLFCGLCEKEYEHIIHDDNSLECTNCNYVIKE